MGNTQQKLIVEKGIPLYVYMNQPSDIIPPWYCFGLCMQDLRQMTYCDEHKETVTEGYNNLVRDTLRKFSILWTKEKFPLKEYYNPPKCET